MQFVKYEKSGHIVTITMNRPDRLNAWGENTSREIGEAFQRYNDDDDARVAILCGAGRSFCAGGDAKEHRDRKERWSNSPQDEMGIFGQGKLFKPVIGAIQGHCLGAGLLLLAMRCDIRIAADNASFGLPEVALGVVNCENAICNQSLSLCALMELTMTADPIDARRAMELGMVNKVVPLDQMMAEAQRMAERIARNAPLAIAQSKRIILKAVEISEEAKELERQMYQASWKSRQAFEGFSGVANKDRKTW